MKRVLAILLMLVAGANAQTIVFFGAGDNIGNSRTNFNGNFSNMLPFVQSAYSGRVDFVGVTNEAAGTAYVVTNSGNRWMLFGTNTGTAAAGAPQGPWTNWIAGATYGVSNAGTYNMADTNLVLITLGTNKLTIQGTASQPTNVAWNNNSLWNIGGGWDGVETNRFLCFDVGYINIAQTNANRLVNSCITNIVLLSVTNVLQDTGPSHGFASGFVNTTSTYFQFQLPAGRVAIEGFAYGNGITKATSGQFELIGLEANGSGSRAVGTNSFGIYQSSASIFGHWNSATLQDGGGTSVWGLPFRIEWDNPSSTNYYRLIYMQTAGGFSGENAYLFKCVAWFYGKQ